MGDLASLNVGRYGHGCSSFVSGAERVSVTQYISMTSLSKLGKLSRSLGDPVRIPRVLQPDFVFRGYKVHVVWFLVKDRQVQHNFRESRHQCSSCPNFACHKCLARESNPRHLCSKQSILPLDHHSRIKLELGNSNDILQARNLSSSCKPQPCSQVLL